MLTDVPTMTSSITLTEQEQSLIYAQTIQNGLLPKKRHFAKNFKDHFVLYKPQNKIGGDFYWHTKKDDTVYFALADCTGHGISGAMLSVLGISLLNYVFQKKLTNVGDYLTALDKSWIETFNNDHHDTLFNNDWMEITLISYNTVSHEFQYSSAGGEFLLCQNESVKLLKGNSYPIGGWQIEKNRRFETFHLDLKPTYKCYFFSDGIKHQFDSSNKKKFSRKRLINSIAHYSRFNMQHQSELFEFIFDTWKEDTRQTDDITLIGIEF
jgi:serine phosphatase RsbU (regulator of sigma subunit)